MVSSRMLDRCFDDFLEGVSLFFCRVVWYFDAPFYKYSECSSSGGNEILEKVWWFLYFLYERDRRVVGGS